MDWYILFRRIQPNRLLIQIIIVLVEVYFCNNTINSAFAWLLTTSEAFLLCYQISIIYAAHAIFVYGSSTQKLCWFVSIFLLKVFFDGCMHSADGILMNWNFDTNFLNLQPRIFLFCWLWRLLQCYITVTYWLLSLMERQYVGPNS